MKVTERMPPRVTEFLRSQFRLLWTGTLIALSATVLLYLLTYAPWGLAGVNLTLTCAALVFILYSFVLVAEVELLELEIIAFSAAVGVALCLQATWLLLGLASGLRVAVPDQSISGLAPVASLVFLFGFLAGHMRAVFDRRHPRGSYRTLVDFFKDESDSTRQFQGWRRKGRLVSLDLVAWCERYRIGSWLLPIFLAVTGVVLVLEATSSDVVFGSLLSSWGTFWACLIWAAVCLSIYPIGRTMGMLAGRIAGEFVVLMAYLREMLLPAVTFVVGYAILTLAFTGLFAAIADSRYCHDVPCFAAASTIDASDYLYLSVTTISTVGYGHNFVSAQTPLAKGAITLELFFGLAWVALIVVAMAAYLTPRFEAITRAHKHARLLAAC